MEVGSAASQLLLSRCTACWKVAKRVDLQGPQDKKKILGMLCGDGCSLNLR